MGRPSTQPTFPTIAAAQRAILAREPIALRGRQSKSGGEWHGLTDKFHRADARCIMCDLPTIRTRWHGAQTAELVQLVPSSAVDGASGLLRWAYVQGNLAIACAACNDARATFARESERVVILAPTRTTRRTVIGGVPVVVVGLDLDPSRVWLVWGDIVKGSAPAAPSRDEAIYLMREAPRHAARAAASRASKGLPF